MCGTRDAHAKNFSLLHTRSGVLRLAPLYDLMATRRYPTDDYMAMYVDTVQNADRVTPERTVNEATRWGIRRTRADEIVSNVLDRLPDAVEAAANVTAAVPQELVDLVIRRVDRLLSASPRASASRSSWIT